MLRKSICAAGLCLALVACETSEDVDVSNAPTAPEFYPCNRLSDAIKTADELLRNPSNLPKSEQAYWYDRKDRLIKRYWDCKA